METHDLALISDYLAGELSENARQEVEQRLQADAAFAALLREQEGNIAVLRAATRAEAKSALRNQYQKVKKKQAITRRLWVYSAVATLAAMALLFVWMLPRQAAPSPEQMALGYLEPFPLDNIRGETPAEQSLLDSAFSAYREGKYAVALSFFQTLHLADPNDLQLALYLGECLSQTGRYTEAAQIFAPLAETSPFRDVAQWHLSLTLLLSGQDSLAYDHLKEIQQSAHHYRQAQASELLKAMEEK